jgi:DNA-binding NarL/FixJ family response regulator
MILSNRVAILPNSATGHAVDAGHRTASQWWTSAPTDPPDPPPPLDPPEARTRVLVVDDHPVTRLGIRRLIAAEEDLEVCGEAETAQAALALVTQVRPRLAIVDLTLPESTGVELIRRLLESVPGLTVLVLSMHDEALYAERALRAGARGYIMKSEAITGLVGAIRTVLAGRIYVSEAVSRAILERVTRENTLPDKPLRDLTDRELEIFNLIGRGLTTVAIASQLGVSIKTIETYRSNVRRKLNLRSATDLTRFATAWVEGLSSS